MSLHADAVASAPALPLTRAGDLRVRASTRLGFVDLTEPIQRAVTGAGLVEGACIAFARHTTCALVVNEWEDGALDDLRRGLERFFPPDAYYAHDDLARRTQNLTEEERTNGHAHLAQMFLGGTSVTVPVREGSLLLGRWQRIVFVELDGPRERTIALQMLGPAGNPPAGANPAAL
jgi:secondary thiamine-phosphate synthase enzyme